jgi:hypothetical protein
MAEGKSVTLTDKQLLDALRSLLQQSGGKGSSFSSSSQQAEISVGDLIGEVVLHVIGAIPDIVVEVVTDGIPDVAEIADWVGELVLDIGKEVVIHLIVDVILDLAIRPVDPGSLQTGGIISVAQERFAHARMALDLASQRTPAPSSRELAALRKILLQAKSKSTTK